MNKETIEYTMGFRAANVYAFLLAFPILAILLLPFVMIWDYETFKVGKDAFMDYFFAIFFGGIVIHELLHAITFWYFVPNGRKSIKFGIKWLTPYCHCKKPLKVKHYKLSAAMPLIILGLIPSIIGIILGHGGILSFGIFFTWAAGGDIMILFMLRKLDNNTYVFDHPGKIGFYREIESIKDSTQSQLDK